MCTDATETARTIIHDPADPQTNQLSQQFVEQKNRESFEQKNLQPQASEAGSIVATIILRKVATKKYISSAFTVASLQT
jgi:hypothetical protein